MTRFCSLASVATISFVSLVLSAPAAPAQVQTSPGAEDVATKSYLAGNGLLSRGMYELAGAEYRKFLAEHADHAKAPIARYGLGVCLLRMNDPAGAEVELKQVVDLKDFEFAPEAMVALAQCQVAREEFGDAAAGLRRVLKSYPKHALAPVAASMYVEALYRDGHAPQASQAAEEFVNTWPESPSRPRAELFGALSLLQQKEYEKAAALLGSVAENDKGELGPRATLLLAQCWQRAGQTEKAIAVYRSIIDAPAGAKADAKRESFVPDATLGLAQTLVSAGKPKEAGDVLDRFLKKNPDHPLAPGAHFERGRAFFDLAQYDKARSEFERAATDSTQPGDEVLYWCAKCDLRSGHASEAARRLVDIEKNFPKSALLPEITYDSAVALDRGGDTSGALERCGRFLADFPGHSLAPDAAYLSADILFRTGKYSEARAVCERFVEADHNHALVPNAAFLIAETLLLEHHEEQAAKAYQTFLDRYPSSPLAERARFRLGCAEFQSGRPENAAPLLEPLAKGRRTAPEFRSALLILGDMAYRSGDFDRAASLLQDFLFLGDDQPSADDALLKLGLCRERLGNHRAALDAFDSLLAKHQASPLRAQAVFERAQTLLAMNRADDAVAGFRQVLSDYPDSPFAAFANNNLGAALLAKGNSAEAISLLVAASKTDDPNLKPEALFNLARALQGAGRHKEASELFERVAKEFPAYARADEAGALGTISAARAGRCEEALAQIERLSTDSTKITPALHQSLAYEKACCLRDLGRPAEAAAVLKELLAANPGPEIAPYASLDLASSLSDTKDDAGAAELLQKTLASLKSDPRFRESELVGRANYQLGACEFRLGHFDRAALLMKEFADHAPESALAKSARLVLGESLFRLGRFKEAAPHLAAAADSTDKDPSAGPAALRLGECLGALQQWAESERVFTKYLEQYPTSDTWFQAQFGIAWAEENQGHRDRAMAAYRVVVDRHNGPTAARAQFQIGECLFADKKFEEAARELLKVDILYAYPEWSAGALFEAGRCFEQLKNPVQARAQFDRVREKYGDSKWAKMAAQRSGALASAPGADAPK